MPQFSVFFKEWDQCIDDWFQNPSNLTGRLKPFQNVGCSLCYLPEPYYGDPECCSAVVININPGSSSPDEHVKEWPNQNNPSDFLIYDFAHKYSGNYLTFRKIILRLWPHRLFPVLNGGVIIEMISSEGFVTLAAGSVR